MHPIAPAAPPAAPPAACSAAGAAPMRCTEAIVLVAAVRGALGTGLLDALDRWAPCPAAELAARIHLDVRVVTLVLDALAVGGVVTHAGDDWLPTAPSASWAAMHGVADHIAEFIRTGAPVADRSEGRYVAPLRVIGEFTRPMIDAALPHVARPGARVLELGAGTAPWSRSIVAGDPTATAVAVDLAPVTAQLRADLQRDGIDRIECVVGDVRTVEPLAAPGTGSGFDVVVVSGLCRLLGAADNASLLRRSASWLTPSGRLVLCDAFADSDDPDGSLALYALGLAARTEAETLWTSAHYERWCADAGLAPLTVLARGRAGHAVAVTGRP